MGSCNCSMYWCALLCVSSSFAKILMGKRELVALLILSSWCLMIVVWLFLAVSWVCVHFVIVLFPRSYSLRIYENMHAKNRSFVLFWFIHLKAINQASPPYKGKFIKRLFITPF